MSKKLQLWLGLGLTLLGVLLAVPLAFPLPIQDPTPELSGEWLSFQLAPRAGLVLLVIGVLMLAFDLWRWRPSWAVGLAIAVLLGLGTFGLTQRAHYSVLVTDRNGQAITAQLTSNNRQVHFTLPANATVQPGDYVLLTTWPTLLSDATPLHVIQLKHNGSVLSRWQTWWKKHGYPPVDTAPDKS